ncbi:MAG: RsmB/NOP family class I SAM-dependent RNA methyltransferase [Oligoflexia bacterium]|nr:RsmB/NOP family class I SAM-dependent RNA methyltransferase [Oligoflexia bacterium]
MKYHAVLVQSVIDCLKDIFENNFYADKVLEHHFKKNKKFGKRDRHFIAHSVFEMTRWWRTLCAFDEQAWVPENYYLRWLVYEYWKNGQDLQDFLVSKIKKTNLNLPIDLKKLVNKEIPLSDRLSFSDWFIEKVKKDYGDDFEKILNSLNNPAPVYLRVNTLKTTKDKLITLLESENVLVTPVEGLENALMLKERANVFITKAYKEGLFEVQDKASQMVAELLDPKPGERVADVCAGAGGKTLHLAALMQNKGTLLASDVHSKKLEELKIRAKRAGVSNLTTQLVENTKDIKKHFNKFDALLIDAPCSGSGVIRRSPDSKWKFKLEDLEKIKITQQEVLNTYSKFLKPKGRMVYATCSILKEENEGQINNFIKENPHFNLVKSMYLSLIKTIKMDFTWHYLVSYFSCC